MASKYTIIVSTPSQNLVYKDVDSFTENRKEGVLTFMRGKTGYATTSAIYTIICEGEGAND